MSNPAVERLAKAIEHTAWMQAAMQAAGIGWTPRGCSQDDFTAARKELRDALGDLFLGPIMLGEDSLTRIASQIAERVTRSPQAEAETVSSREDKQP